MKKLLYIFLGLSLIFACSDDSSDDNNDNNEPSNCDIVYLDDNGVTIKACDDAIAGDVGIINGVEYTVVNREMLDDRMTDLSVLCTTLVTDMSLLQHSSNNFTMLASFQPA